MMQKRMTHLKNATLFLFAKFWIVFISKFFRHWIMQWICNKVVTKDPSHFNLVTVLLPPLPPKMPPPIIHDSLGFWESIPQTASRSVQPFLQNSRLWPTNGRYIRNNWPHLMLCIAMQPHNNNNSKDFIPPYAAFSEVFVSRRRK